MWETICDAWACWSGWNFGPNSTVYPYSVEYPLPLPLPLSTNEDCQRVQVRVQNTPPKWRLSESPSPSTEYPPKWKLSESPSPSTEYPPKWKLSESPNPRVSEYPPKMKIVREFKSESFRIPPLSPSQKKSEKLQISNFKTVSKSGRSMWRLICNPPGYHSFWYISTNSPKQFHLKQLATSHLCNVEFN